MRILILSEVKIFHFWKCNRFSSRCENFSLLGTKPLRLEVKFVDVGLALSTALDGQPADLLELLQIRDETAASHTHILGNQLLAGIAIVVLPCVAQEQGIGELRAWRDRVGVEQEIRHHCE